MKLLKEMVADQKILIEEGAEGKPKSYFIEGVWLQANIKNRNGRMYPMPVLEREVKRYTNDYIKENRAVGELGHPDTPTINLDRVSHKILELHREGDNFVGRAKLLDTPSGKIAKNFIDEGIKIGVSSRGLGSLKTTNEGVNIVQDDYYLATGGDIVADPSAPDAFVNGIVENKEWLFDERLGWIPQFLDETKHVIQNMSAREIHEKKAQLFETFLRRLGGLEDQQQQQLDESQEIRHVGSNMIERHHKEKGHTVLYSYNTPVAAHIPGEGFVRTAKKWSVTTSKHISKWLQHHGCPHGHCGIKSQEYFDKLD